MNYIFEPDVEEAASKVGSNFIKAVEFENGLTIKILSAEKVKANNPKYGAEDGDYLVKNEILEVGETFRYKFEENGVERTFDSASTPFFIGMRQSGAKPGDLVKILRTGKTDQTRYTVEVVTAQTNSKTVSDKDVEDSIPF